MALGASPAGDYIYQKGPLAPLRDSHVYVLKGSPSPDGCTYQYPPLTVGPNETAKLQRDIGIDLLRCLKLVEEGVPTAIAASNADSSISAPVGSTASKAGLATASISTGYHAAWYENISGI